MAEPAQAIGVAFCVIFTFMMQIGFAMLETGASLRKNAQNVVMKNMVDACAVSLAFWLFGWALVYGDGTRVIGLSKFATADTGGDSLLRWSAEWAFCLNSATIFGGSAAGRTRFVAFVIVASSVGMLTYPLAARWVWHEEGFLRRLGDVGVLDFSGSGVVHMLGGTVGLVISVFLNPRLLRVKDNDFVHVPSHNAILASLGVMFLWGSWYAFNTLPILFLPTSMWTIVCGRVLVNTTLGAISAGMTVFVFDRVRDCPYRLPEFGNCILAGLVAITGPCAFVVPWAAVLIGVLAAFTFIGTSNLLVRLRIDDPLNAFPVHGASGALGLLSVGALANPDCVKDVYGLESTDDYGFVYGGNFRQFGFQLLGLVVLVSWAAAVTTLVALVLRWRGMLQVGREAELQGQDIYKHGGRAYPEFAFPPDDSMSEDRASLEDRETWRAQEMLGFAVEPRVGRTSELDLPPRYPFPYPPNHHQQQQQQQQHQQQQHHPYGNGGAGAGGGGGGGGFSEPPQTMPPHGFAPLYNGQHPHHQQYQHQQQQQQQQHMHHQQFQATSDPRLDSKLIPSEAAGPSPSDVNDQPQPPSPPPPQPHAAAPGPSGDVEAAGSHASSSSSSSTRRRSPEPVPTSV